MLRPTRWICLISLLFSLISPLRAAAAGLGQTPTPPDPEVVRILASLTPEERVGQLFIVTFKGTSLADKSPIHELIAGYHVGGVALSASNDNFADTGAFKSQLLALTAGLQSIEAGLAPPGPATAAAASTPAAEGRQFIPLFIATSYDESYTSNSLLPGLSGLTPLPSLMAIGATWNPAHAETAGRIAGQELSALGINMLFGPTLDVLETPQPAGAADPGSRAFGGDPYWVSLLGRSFIHGVHTGSDNRIAVVARHFPGYGASDRTLEEQVPTVNKQLAELRAIDLAPFFAVTRAGMPDSTDALLVSHIRYRGFQGNIRDTTKPISFDPQALGTLLSLPEIAVWRASGGVTVSDALGARAVRRFYDPSGRTFLPFNIARDALLAGNDMLYVAQFGPDPEADGSETVKVVLRRFVEKYREDPAFASRVDEAVTRVLALKLRVFGEFAVDAAWPRGSLQALGAQSAETFTITSHAATLISPSPVELADRLPAPPLTSEQISFFTDTRTTRQCNSCQPHPVLASDALLQAVLRLYGPQGTREVFAPNLSSFTFADLADFLEGRRLPPTATPEPTPPATPGEGTPTATPPPAPQPIGEAIASAEWLVFAMLDVRSAVPASNALSRLLAERPDLVRGRRVIVFAFDAPYYLDTTEVAQLTAYYALYSKNSQAVEVAARILFQEVTPAGASPVSVPAIGYNLFDMTQPNPDQVIPLFADVVQPEGATPMPPELTPTPPAFALNSVVGLRTGVIVDRNGHPVPDGTVVRFFVTYAAEGLTVQVAEATTLEGVARASLRLDRSGLLEVRVTSEPALTSFTLQFDAKDSPSPPVVITPTPEPTFAPRPSRTPAVTATAGALPTPAPVARGAGPVTGADLLWVLLTLAVMGLVGWRLAQARIEAVSPVVKVLLTIAIGVLGSYNYFALGLPGAEALMGLGPWALVAAIWIGGAVGLAAGWLWFIRQG